ncbi:hypothetical protein FQA39_LY07961 [Lamprigera yunnana]|nr:hypothetical protein FQA39_LY07961 [Lamprigera yunnana]
MHCLEIEDSSEIRKHQNEKCQAAKSQPKYRLPVKIGNWNEDLFLEEERLRPVELAKEAPYVTYGTRYQIQVYDIPSQIVSGSDQRAKHGLVLAGIMNEKHIEEASHFVHGCDLTLSPDKEPRVRNTFMFVGCDGQLDRQNLYYGDDVYIRICESGVEGHLLLQCKNSLCNEVGKHLHLQLTQTPDFYCRFKIFHWNPQDRFVTSGSPFPPNTRIIIQHSASGKNLACLYKYWVPTLFGDECTVTCYNFKDTHRMETDENFWKIVSQIIPDKSLVLRVSKGEDLPLDQIIE